MSSTIPIPNSYLGKPVEQDYTVHLPEFTEVYHTPDPRLQAVEGWLRAMYEEVPIIRFRGIDTRFLERDDLMRLLLLIMEETGYPHHDSRKQAPF